MSKLTKVDEISFRVCNWIMSTKLGTFVFLVVIMAVTWPIKGYGFWWRTLAASGATLTGLGLVAWIIKRKLHKWYDHFDRSEIVECVAQTPFIEGVHRLRTHDDSGIQSKHKLTITIASNPDPATQPAIVVAGFTILSSGHIEFNEDGFYRVEDDHWAVKPYKWEPAPEAVKVAVHEAFRRIITEESGDSNLKNAE